MAVDFIFPAKKIVINLTQSTLKDSSVSDTFPEDEPVLLHANCVLCSPIKRSIFARRFMSRKARICGSELQRYHFRPTQIDDARTKSAKHTSTIREATWSRSPHQIRVFVDDNIVG